MLSRRTLIALTTVLGVAACSPGDSAAIAAPAPAQADSGRRETAVFAGGCFWSVEANF